MYYIIIDCEQIAFCPYFLNCETNCVRATSAS